MFINDGFLCNDISPTWNILLFGSGCVLILFTCLTQGVLSLLNLTLKMRTYSCNFYSTHFELFQDYPRKFYMTIFCLILFHLIDNSKFQILIFWFLTFPLYTNYKGLMTEFHTIFKFAT